MVASGTPAARAQRGNGSTSATDRSGKNGCSGTSTPVYRRHEADKTVLHQIVSEQLETFLSEVRNHYDKPLPAYIEKELRAFIDCGILARGFVTAVCQSCGHTLLVALSCKKRGICPVSDRRG